MRSSFAEANHQTILEMCVGADAQHGQQLQQQLENIYLNTFGLDYLIDEQKRTILHVLAANKEFCHWEILLKGFVYLDGADSHLQTALHIAVLNQNLKAIRHLIENCASPLVEDEPGNNPIHLACISNYSAGLSEILKSYHARSYILANILKVGRICIDNKAKEAFSVLVSRSSSKSLNTVDKEGLALIHYIILANLPDYLSILLKHKKIDINLKARIDKIAKTPLDMATTSEIAEILFARNAIYNKKNTSMIIQKLIQAASEWQQKGLSYCQSDLHKAVKESNMNYIRQYKGIIDVVDSFGETPLMLSIKEKDITILEELLNKGANPLLLKNDLIELEMTAYHLAALFDADEALSKLISKIPPDFSLNDIYGRSIITCCIVNGSCKCLQTLMKMKPSFDTSVMQIMKYLLKLDDNKAAKIADILLKNGFPIDIPTENDSMLLKEAFDLKLFQLTEVLLKNNALSCLKESADVCFINAVIDELPIVEVFISFGANPDINHAGRPLLHETANHTKNDTRVAMLKGHDYLINSLDSIQSTFLHRAAFLNNPLGIKDGLTLFSINPNEVNSNGESPLHFLMKSVSNNFEECLKILINAGANAEILNNKKQNIFHICAEHNNDHAINVLFDSLPEETINNLINQPDSDGKTPITVASKRTDTRCAKALSKRVHLPIFDSPLTLESVNDLINQGFSVNIYNKSGYPLLTVAILMYSNENENEKSMIIDLVKKIISAESSDPSIQDINKTGDDYEEPLRPLHHAIIVGCTEIASALIDKGASFCVSPGTLSLAETYKRDDICALVKLPERRAGSIEELYTNQKNARDIIDAVLMRVKENIGILKNPRIELYITEMFFMHRLLCNFVQRLEVIFRKLKPDSEVGNFLVYFSDAFLPILDMSPNYEDAIEVLNKDANFSGFLRLSCGIGVQTVDDAIIVPTQLFTRYTDLIKAVIKVTPQDHPDFGPLQKALNKFSYIGRTSNERKLIKESQRELQLLKLVTTINDQQTPFSLNDILYFHGQFEKKSYKKPGGTFEVEEKNDPYAESNDWGLRTIKRKIGHVEITSYNGFGSSMDSFLNKNKIAVFLFRNSILFGVRKTSDKFKLKFSCRSSEVLWDFGKEFAPDSVMLYAPFGSMLLKCLPPKGTLTNFERNRWRSDVDKLSVIPEGDEESIGGFEYCYVSWVGDDTKCVHSKSFFVICKSKTEAKKLIHQKLTALGVAVKLKSSQMGDPIPMINYDFQTFKRNEGQESDVISDIFE